jgi:hypothetical protein
MLAFDEPRKPRGESAYVAYAGRRDNRRYLHSHEELLERYSPALCMCSRVPDALSDDLGNTAYIVRLPRKADIDAWFQAGNSMPRTIEKTQEMLSQWAE